MEMVTVVVVGFEGIRVEIEAAGVFLISFWLRWGRGN